jgi:hypothetical protein
MPTTTLPGMPGGPIDITVSTFLKQPNLIAARIQLLAWQGYVTDRIFAQGNVQGGAYVFQRMEGLFPADSPEHVNPLTEYPMTGWTVPGLFGAAVKKYGLETIISDETRRRNQVDQMERAFIKLSNGVVKFVDSVAMQLFLNDPDIPTYDASTWSSSTTKINDLMGMQKAIADLQLGFVPDTVLLNPAQRLQLLTDKDIRDALPRENTNLSSVLTGDLIPILGLNYIVSPQVPANKVIMLQAKMTGTIADEAPLPEENYNGRNIAAPGSVASSLYVKTYRSKTEGIDGTIVRAARFPALAIQEPKSALVADVS